MAFGRLAVGTASFGDSPTIQRTLLAVDGQANSKSSLTADQWLPPDRAFRCKLREATIAVKSAYGLSVTRAEQGCDG